MGIRNQGTKRLDPWQQLKEIDKVLFLLLGFPHLIHQTLLERDASPQLLSWLQDDEWTPLDVGLRVQPG